MLNHYIVHLKLTIKKAPLSMEFSRQEYWSGLPFPSPGDFPKPGIELRSPALQADSLLSEPPGKPVHQDVCPRICVFYPNKQFQKGVFFCGLSAMVLMKFWSVIHVCLVKMSKYMTYSQFAVRAGFLCANSFHEQVCICDSNGMRFISEKTNCWFLVLRSTPPPASPDNFRPFPFVPTRCQV